MVKLRFSIPTSYQWVSIPVQPIDKVTIAWSEGFQARTAVYFKCTGYWGPLLPHLLAPQPTVPQGPAYFIGHQVQARGIVDVYIAAPYVLDNFRDGPFVLHHLPGLVSNAKSNRWITMELNESFEFGQHNNRRTGDLERFLVYHPSVVPGVPTPYIFQHRFTGSLSDALPEYLEDVVDLLPKEHGVKAAGKASAKAFSAIYDWGKSIVGHPLHRFLDISMRQALKQYANDSYKSNLEMDGETWLVTCAQYLESKYIRAANKASKTQEKARIGAMTAAVEKLEKDMKIQEDIAKLMALKDPDAEQISKLAVQMNEPEAPAQTVVKEEEQPQGTEVAKTGDDLFIDEVTVVEDLSVDALLTEIERTIGSTKSSIVVPGKNETRKTADTKETQEKPAKSNEGQSAARTLRKSSLNPMQIAQQPQQPKQQQRPAQPEWEDERTRHQKAEAVRAENLANKNKYWPGIGRSIVAG